MVSCTKQDLNKKQKKKIIIKNNNFFSYLTKENDLIKHF